MIHGRKVWFLTPLVITFVVSVNVSARPYVGEEITFTEPDGGQLPLLLYGDEYYIRAETRDGYTVVRDEKSGCICYAKISENGNALVSTGIRLQSALGKKTAPTLTKGIRLSEDVLRAKIEAVKKALWGNTVPPYNMNRMEALPKRAAADSLPPHKAPATYQGTCTGLALVWDFPDAPITALYPTADSAINFISNKIYNSLDPKDVSLRYDFQIYSGGKFDLAFIVKGVWRAPHTFSYYDSLSYGLGQSQLVAAALKSLDSAGFDFTQLSLNADKTIRGLCCCNTGNPKTWAEGMWDHTGYTSVSWSAHGIKLGEFNCCGANGDGLQHEMGHLICGWPDLYSSTNAATGTWDIMGGGGNANIADPYLLYLVGWDQVVNVVQYPAGTVVHANGTDPNTGHVYFRNAKQTEFFFIKPYTKKMPLCSGITDQGLTIWHINTKGNNFDYPTTPLLVEMEHASNTISNVRTNVCFKAGGTTSFSGTTTPSSLWTDNTVSGLDIDNFSAADTTMTFSMGPTTGISPARVDVAHAKSSIRIEKRGGLFDFICAVPETEAGRLEILAASGKVIFQGAVHSGKFEVPAARLPAGLYLAHYSSQTLGLKEKIAVTK